MKTASTAFMGVGQDAQVNKQPLPSLALFIVYLFLNISRKVMKM